MIDPLNICHTDAVVKRRPIPDRVVPPKSQQAGRIHTRPLRRVMSEFARPFFHRHHRHHNCTRPSERVKIRRIRKRKRKEDESILQQGKIDNGRGCYAKDGTLFCTHRSGTLLKEVQIEAQSHKKERRLQIQRTSSSGRPLLPSSGAASLSTPSLAFRAGLRHVNHSQDFFLTAKRIILYIYGGKKGEVEQKGCKRMVSRWTATKVFKIAIFFLKKIESSSVQGTRCLHLARLAHTVKGRYEPQELPAKHYERALWIIWKQKKSCVGRCNRIQYQLIN